MVNQWVSSSGGQQQPTKPEAHEIKIKKPKREKEEGRTSKSNQVVEEETQIA